MRDIPANLIEIAKRHKNGESLLKLSKEYGIEDSTLARRFDKYNLIRKKHNKIPMFKNCVICGKQFRVFESTKNRRCCSKTCSGKWRSIYHKGQKASAFKSVQKVCVICGKLFWVDPYHVSTKKTCSKRCFKKLRSITTSGKNNPNYRNGITPKIIRLRYSQQYIEWRNAVYERDCWTCQQCGQVGRRLQAHHILSFTKYPNKRFEIDNGITLCVPCHQKLHRRLEAKEKYA